jgi:hypothetical protein
MLTIFKYFFGIIGIIILVYVLVIVLRNFLTTGFNTISEISTNQDAQDKVLSGSETLVNKVKNFSIWEFIKSFHPSPYAPMYITHATNSGAMYYAGEYSISENLVNNNNITWGNTSDTNFDTKWGPQVKQQKIYNYFNNEKLIESSTKSGDYIYSGQVISGVAHTSVFSDNYFWGFVLDERGSILGKGKMFMNGEIRDNLVPFRGVIEFYTVQNQIGFLVLRNENTSSLGASAIRTIQVNLYKKSVNSTKSCVVSGCSMQFCVDQENLLRLNSSCEWRPAYACYKQAICERNKQTGQCGWRLDNTLATCLQQNI